MDRAWRYIRAHGIGKMVLYLQQHLTLACPFSLLTSEVPGPLELSGMGGNKQPAPRVTRPEDTSLGEHRRPLEQRGGCEKSPGP